MMKGAGVDRGSRRVALTADGRAFFAHTEEILGRVRGLELGMQERQGLLRGEAAIRMSVVTPPLWAAAASPAFDQRDRLHRQVRLGGDVQPRGVAYPRESPPVREPRSKDVVRLGRPDGPIRRERLEAMRPRAVAGAEQPEERRRQDRALERARVGDVVGHE